ncbi:MAG: hypothetical protein C0506_00655 [Anaerolinea sp.]|nr:hypothetical protein [Anaerolinea sp.]
MVPAMTPTHQAALTTARDSFAMFAEALEGLPDEALSWRPEAENTNSIAVLATHCVTATRFWLGLGAGQVGSIGEYRERFRAPSFEVSGAAAVELKAQFEAILTEITEVMGRGSEEHLTARIEWPEDPSMTPSGAEALFRAIGHLREHVGQAQLMRDLWLARG